MERSLLSVKSVGRGELYRVQKEPNSTPITVHIDHMKNYGHGDTPEVWIAGNGLNFREMGVQVNFQ